MKIKGIKIGPHGIHGKSKNDPSGSTKNSTDSQNTIHNQSSSNVEDKERIRNVSRCFYTI